MQPSQREVTGYAPACMLYSVFQTVSMLFRGCRLVGSDEQAGAWGHEYVRNLAGEISSEFQHREEQDADVQDLLDLVSQIMQSLMQLTCCWRLKSLNGWRNMSMTRTTAGLACIWSAAAPT